MIHFSVKNFDRFQHYKDRSPPWIKLYNELLDDYEFGLLPDATKMHLIAIWLLASRSENKIPFDPTWVARRINANDPVNLALLAERGFIILDQPLQGAEQIASNTQAERLSREEGQVQHIEQKIGGGVESASEPKSKSMISQEAFTLTDQVLTAMGKDIHDPISVGVPLTIQGWFNSGWNAECILIGVKRGMVSRNGDPPTTLKYFEKAIARAHAELTPSVPKAEIRQSETFQVNHGTSQNRSSVVAVAKRYAEQFESQSSGRIEGDPDAFLRLSQG